MPPWLPDGPRDEFVGDRRLTDEQINLLRRWLKDGALEGQVGDLPAAPQFPSDWSLGPPDFVVTLPQAYSLQADGTNVYRNFVVPLGLKEKRLVRALDFRPHSAGVHHALFAFDSSGTALQWDARDPEPGFSSFTLPAGMQTPNDFLGWHPGKQPVQAPRGLTWEVVPSDLVLQLHLRPTGKAEQISPEVAFYFAREAPTNQPLKISISPLNIAIPAGATNHLIRGAFNITGDCDLLALEPHAHFLAKQVTGSARFPDGTRRTLLHVPDWDFTWQDYYRFTKPVFLPAGTVLEMEWIYDNSVTNPRNPHSPSRLVRYGVESDDEMAVLTFQVLPRNNAAADRITQALLQDTDRHNVEYNVYLLERDPNNERARVGLARALFHFNQLDTAAEQINIARQLDPKDDDAALLAGMIAQLRKRPDEARSAFEDCVRLNPNLARGHGCLAVLATEQGWYDVAELHFREALRIDPTDETARDALRKLGARK
jgi:Tfp pilus assembly protein PilF